MLPVDTTDAGPPGTSASATARPKLSTLLCTHAPMSTSAPDDNTRRRPPPLPPPLRARWTFRRPRIDSNGSASKLADPLLTDVVVTDVDVDVDISVSAAPTIVAVAVVAASDKLTCETLSTVVVVVSVRVMMDTDVDDALLDAYNTASDTEGCSHSVDISRDIILPYHVFFSSPHLHS